MVSENKCDLSFRCWECTKDCPTKTIFELPEPKFTSTLNRSCKPVAGMMLNSGIPLEQVNKQINTLILTLVTSRQKYLEEKQKLLKV